MMRHLFAPFVLLCCVFVEAEEFAPLFPFVVSYDAPENAVNVASLLDAPAGKHGFVRVKDGTFVTDAGPIRFWATNLTGGANFPDKESAEKLADRLARFGFNCVRLHSMDGSTHFFEKNPKTLRKLDPLAFDRLHYLVAALKKRGIYINVNLHVSRWLDDRDGFPYKDKRPSHDKGLDNFEPRMIELQKEYARDLLTSKNPYTGLSLAEDPVMAMVEINNENSVVTEWGNGSLDELPDPYGVELRKQWNAWLKKKYKTTEEILTAWNCRNIPLGNEMIPGGDFSKPFADLTFRSGGKFGLADDANLEAGTIPTLKKSDLHFSEEFRRDFWQFLIDIERAYWPEMGRFLKEELKVKAPISGTQLYYGSKHVQAALDYCDDHAYWNHPSWPMVRWDLIDWFIRNRALVNWADKDIFPRLATRRIAGKPHTISEYNHPVPNQYAAEGLPMLCAFSRFQGWDGVFQYTYAHKPNIDYDKWTGHFDMIQQVGQLVHAPACANMILRGDVAPAKHTIYGPMSRATELDAFVKSGTPRQIDFQSIGLDSRLALLHATALDLSEGQNVQGLTPSVLGDDQKIFVSDTGELTWNMEQEGKGFFVLKTPKTKVFTGFVPFTRVVDIGGITLFFGNTRLGWATVTLTEVEPKRWLLAASGYMENTDMKFVKYGTADDDRYTVNNNWGTGPVLCEGIPMSVRFPASAGIREYYPLDVSGNRKQELHSFLETISDTSICCDPQYKTLWYEIIAE